MFKQIKKDKSKALLLDKNNQLHKERLKEVGWDDWQQFYRSGSGLYNTSQI